MRIKSNYERELTECNLERLYGYLERFKEDKIRRNRTLDMIIELQETYKSFTGRYYQRRGKP